MKFLLIFIIFVFQLGCNHPESEEYERNQKYVTTTSSDVAKTIVTGTGYGYKVIGVKDGDTLVLLIDGKEQVVRFAHIDCPEKKQPFGKAAKQYVSEMCFGDFVTLIHDNKFDRSKRLIAEVILQDGTNLNKELVENGLAWHFKKYSKDQVYSDLESLARLNKIGLWTDEEALPPWVWRN